MIAGAAPRSAWGKTSADVIVIGAGLAGLQAAHQLERAGLRVIILEGEQRIGGRLHSLGDLPGHPEAGGIQVGQGYHRLRAIAARLGVGLAGDSGKGAGAVETPATLFHINGATLTANAWPTAAANHLAENERAILPLALASVYARAMPQLSAPDAWITADPALDVSYAEALRKAGASDEALRLIEANFNGNTLASMSQLSVLRSTAIYRNGPGAAETIVGGSHRLPEAMAADLATSIRLGQIVTGIEEMSGGVAVSTRNSVFHARHILCTIPFAAMRHLPLVGHIAPSIATLIASLNYTRASFAFLQASEPFWRSDGLGETMWTDDPLLGRLFVLGDDPPMLKLWTTGAGADLLDSLPPDHAAASIIGRIANARPSSRGKLRVLRLFSWQKNTMARGIYHHIGTGQATTLARASQDQGSRIHFAGEHLAQANSGMEAALESGERAASTIIRTTA